MLAVKLAMLWVGHVRTFHNVWPNPTVENLLEPLGVAEATHHFYTYPAAQCHRNRPNDPPPDYSPEDALRYVAGALRPDTLEVRESSSRADLAVAAVRRARAEQGNDWANLEALTRQYVRRTEAWEAFVASTPGWRDLDAIAFNRPDVFLYQPIAKPTRFDPDEIHCFTSLGPRKDEAGLDDRWALGHPLAVERYMRVGDSVVQQYAVEKRPWCPEEVNRRHADRSGLRIVKCAYQGDAWNAPEWERGHVGIARFNDGDGRSLKQALRALDDDRRDAVVTRHA